MIKMYGIPNCDTVKKAKKYLETRDIDFEFSDFKKIPPTKALLSSCEKLLGELPINKRGTTFRKLKSDFEKAKGQALVKLIIENSSVIKRPILEKDGNVIAVGFKADEYDQLI